MYSGGFFFFSFTFSFQNHKKNISWKKKITPNFFQKFCHKDLVHKETNLRLTVQVSIFFFVFFFVFFD